MMKAGFGTEKVKSVVSMPKDRVASGVTWRNLSRFLFGLACPVLMQPVVLSCLKI